MQSCLLVTDVTCNHKISTLTCYLKLHSLSESMMYWLDVNVVKKQEKGMDQNKSWVFVNIFYSHHIRTLFYSPLQITSDKPTKSNENNRYPPSDQDVQKKITLLSNPSAILHELFPHSDHLASLVASLSESGDGSTLSMLHPQQEKSGLVVAASLLSKIPNLGGKFFCWFFLVFTFCWSILLLSGLFFGIA